MPQLLFLAPRFFSGRVSKTHTKYTAAQERCDTGHFRRENPDWSHEWSSGSSLRDSFAENESQEELRVPNGEKEPASNDPFSKKTASALNSSHSWNSLGLFLGLTSDILARLSFPNLPRQVESVSNRSVSYPDIPNVTHSFCLQWLLCCDHFLQLIPHKISSWRKRTFLCDTAVSTSFHFAPTVYHWRPCFNMSKSVWAMWNLSPWDRLGPNPCCCGIFWKSSRRIFWGSVCLLYIDCETQSRLSAGRSQTSSSHSFDLVPGKFLL